MLPVNVVAGLSRTNRRTSIIRSGCMTFSLRKKSLAPLGSFLMFLLMGTALGPDSSLKGVDLRLASCTIQNRRAKTRLTKKPGRAQNERTPDGSIATNAAAMHSNARAVLRGASQAYRFARAD